MPKRIYQIGEPCDQCGTPTIQGQKGVYCKPCYVAWKNSQEALQPAVGGFHPQTAQNAAQVNLKPYSPIPDVSSRVKEAQDNKQESMRLFSSGRDATLIVCAEMGQGSAWSDDKIKERIKFWDIYFYSRVYNDDPIRGQ